MRQGGTSLIEVLVTILILAFGLLGLAGSQNLAQSVEFEAFQRAQATLLLAEMSDRMSANRGNAASYVVAGTLGTGDSPPPDCASLAIGAPRDLCEWSKALKGASETKGTSSVGAMLGARGCITQLQAENAAAGVCTPGIYQITVAWQGFVRTKSQSITCGTGSYGASDGLRRAVSTQAVVSLPRCS
jgi:type IV pilus assembly protein PilV